MSFAGYLRADTQTNVTIGPVVAVGDGYTPVTNLSLSTADEAELIKHNATTTTSISALTMAAITGADGYYALTLTAAVLDTEGRVTVAINDDSLCLPVRADFMVQNANVYDSLHAAATTDYLQVDAIQISGDATAADNCELMFDGTGYAGGTTKLGVDTVAISGDTTAANNAELAFDGTGYGFTNCTIPTVTTLTGHTAQTGDSFARIGATGSGLSSLAPAATALTNATWTDARAAYLDELAAANLPTDVSAASIATAVWNAATATYGSAGSYGLLIETDLDAAISTRAPSSTALTNATWTDAKAGYLTAAVATATELAKVPKSDGTSTWNATALESINGEVADVLTTDTIADSYSTDGNQPTIAQALLEVRQMMQEKSITDTTLTVKKPDGSTSAMTFTLNSATTPTSITRAT